MEVASGVDELRKSITLADAVRWTVASWEAVTSATIKNCFIKAGFSFPNLQEIPDSIVQPMPNEDIPVLERLMQELHANDITPIQYIDVETNLPTAEIVNEGDWEERLIHQFAHENDSEIISDHESIDSDDSLSESEESSRKITRTEAKKSLQILKQFCEENSQQLTNQMGLFENVFEIYITDRNFNAKQSTLDQFFVKK